jgi:hypothetical protein
VFKYLCVLESETTFKQPNTQTQKHNISPRTLPSLNGTTGGRHQATAAPVGD